MSSPLQVDPNSIAAKDGRIREGDRILQVCMCLFSYVSYCLPHSYIWIGLLGLVPYKMLEKKLFLLLGVNIYQTKKAVI